MASIKIKIERDYWCAEDDRVKAGEVIELDSDIAIQLVNDQIATLVVPDKKSVKADDKA